MEILLKNDKDWEVIENLKVGAMIICYMCGGLSCSYITQVDLERRVFKANNPNWLVGNRDVKFEDVYAVYTHKINLREFDKGSELEQSRMIKGFSKNLQFYICESDREVIEKYTPMF